MKEGIFLSEGFTNSLGGGAELGFCSLCLEEGLIFFFMVYCKNHFSSRRPSTGRLRFRVCWIAPWRWSPLDIDHKGAFGTLVCWAGSFDLRAWVKWDDLGFRNFVCSFESLAICFWCDNFPCFEQIITNSIFKVLSVCVLNYLQSFVCRSLFSFRNQACSHWLHKMWGQASSPWHSWCVSG